MCGVAGFIDTRHRRDDLELCAVATRMATAIAHRGPDGSGTWSDAERGVVLAHRRLAIVDLSPAGAQPMASADGRYVVTFNGEIYNHAELRRRLGDTQGKYRGHSDTEVLVEAIAAWGLERALRASRGMFALAVWDRDAGVLSLARDRLGEKPMFHGWNGPVFLFGSELRALRAHPDFVPTLNRGALDLFTRYNHVPAPYSVYEGIGKLPPGTILRIDPTRPGQPGRPQPYWSLREVAERSVRDPLTCSDPEIVDQVDDKLREAVALQMVADVPVGAFLSGGMDSSTVTALMQSLASGRVRTFSIGFHDEAFNEAHHAAAVARHLGTDHTELYVTAQTAQEVIPRLATVYDEPFADSSQVPTFLVSELARRAVTVSLSGDGGDELFGGYPRYVEHRRLWNSIAWCPHPVRVLAARMLRVVPPAWWDIVFGPLLRHGPARLRSIRPGDLIGHGVQALGLRRPEELYRYFVSARRDATGYVLGGHEPLIGLTDPQHWADLADPTERAMYLDATNYLPDDILVKVDRAAMAVSLESRMPLLDHEVVELAWRIPRRTRLRAGPSKWVLRQILYRYLPPEMVDRPKMGFGVPVGAWIRGPMRPWAEELLSDRRLRDDGILDAQAIRTLWLDHLAGRRDRTPQLWGALMLNQWLSA